MDEASVSSLTDIRKLQPVMEASRKRSIGRDDDFLFAQPDRFFRLEDGSVLVFRHDDLRRLGSHPSVTGVSLDTWLQRYLVDRMPFSIAASELGEVGTFFENVITNLKLGAHDALKPIFARAMSPKAMHGYSPRMEALAAARAAALADGEAIDLLNDFCRPLAFEFWAETLQLTSAEAEALASSLDGVHALVGSRIASREHLTESNRSLATYFSLLTQALQRARGNNPLIDIMAERFDQLDPRPDGTPAVLELCVAASLSDAFGTMPIGATNCVAAMLSQPTAIELIRDGQGLVAKAVNEGLRLYPPLHQFYRQVQVDIELDGLSFPAGTYLAMLWGSGNFDPDHYEQPAHFDIGRKMKPLLTFGTGSQLCPGRNLVAMMSEVMVRLVSQGDYDFVPAGEIVWTPPEILQSLNMTVSCPVKIHRMNN